MASKYDGYWMSILPEIKNLIEQTFQTGHSSKIEVSDIKKCGDRQYWGTRVEIPPGVTKITEKLSPHAHGKSLGNVIIHSGILKDREETLFVRVSKRGEKLYLYFESRRTAKISTPSPANMPEEDEITSVTGESQEQVFIRTVNVLRNIEPQNLFLFGKWKRVSQSVIRKIAILRLCSPQTRVASLRDLEYSDDDMDKLLKSGTSEEEVSTILRKYEIRFPSQKAKRIKHLLALDIFGLVQSIEDLSGASLNQERRARERVMEKIDGMGLKTSSDFLKDIGFSKYLAVLDSRNLKFLKSVGLAPKQLKADGLSKRGVYHELEDIENELAKKIGITVSELDEKIMAYTEKELTEEPERESPSLPEKQAERKVRRLEEENRKLRAKLVALQASQPMIADEELRNDCAEFLKREATYIDAIRRAGVILEERLRKTIGGDGPEKFKVGKGLVDYALYPDSGRLIISEHPAEQEGVRMLFRGALQFVRNPPSHKKMQYTELEAVQAIQLIDYLLSLLQQVKPREE